MNKNNEVEYCNVDLRFDRRMIHTFIKSFIQEGYAMYWSESDTQFVASIRSGVKMIKLKFYRIGDRFKLNGNYMFKDEKLIGLMEKMIGTTRGHAIVKRLRDHHVIIENIMFGEVIRTVEVSGVDHKVIGNGHTGVTIHDIHQAYFSNRIEQRIAQLHQTVDEQLVRLRDALHACDGQAVTEAKAQLDRCRHEMVQLEA